MKATLRTADEKEWFGSLGRCMIDPEESWLLGAFRVEAQLRELIRKLKQVTAVASVVCFLN